MKIKRMLTLLISAVITISVVSFNSNIVKADSVVILDSNGGTGGTASVNANWLNPDMPEITTPTKKGYLFVGYFTSANGQADKYYNADGSSAHGWDKDGGTYTLYARWAKTSLWYWYDFENKVLHLSSYEIDANYTEDIKYLGNYIANDITNDKTPWKDYKSLITKVVIDNKIYPTSTYAWFYNCSNLKKITNISNLDTSNVVWMNYMFGECGSLESLDLSSINTSKVTTFAAMFVNCTNLKKINVTNFNTSEAIHTDSMFNGCVNLEELDLHSFDTSKISDMTNMFGACANLKTIFVSDKFVTTAIPAGDRWKSVFNGCPELVGGNGTTYSFMKTGVEFARIDKPGEPGYFTEYVAPVVDEPVVKDESCEKVIGPTWHWNNEKGVCEEYVLVRTITR